MKTATGLTLVAIGAILAFAALFLGVAAVLVVLLKPQLAEHA